VTQGPKFKITLSRIVLRPTEYMCHGHLTGFTSYLGRIIIKAGKHSFVESNPFTGNPGQPADVHSVLPHTFDS